MTFANLRNKRQNIIGLVVGLSSFFVLELTLDPLPLILALVLCVLTGIAVDFIGNKIFDYFERKYLDQGD